MNTLNPHGARKALIVVGKCIPFILCLIILLTYAETLFACVLSRFCTYGGVVIPNTPLSFVVGRLFEYDYLLVILVGIISIAIEACKWNLMAVLYMFFHLLEKSFFDFEISLEAIYVIIIINIFTCGFIIYKGIKNTFTKTLKLWN